MPYRTSYIIFVLTVIVLFLAFLLETDPGGNDYEIYTAYEVDGNQVQNPQEMFFG